MGRRGSRRTGPPVVAPAIVVSAAAPVAAQPPAPAISPGKKRKRGLREVIFDSPATARAAVASDTPVARRTRAGRAAAAAAVVGPPPAPVIPHADEGEGQEPPRKKTGRDGLSAR